MADLSNDTRFALTRRSFLGGGAAAAAAATVGLPAFGSEADGVSTLTPRDSSAKASGMTMQTTLTINGQAHELVHDPRTTLLDALRENLHLTGTKKGCDHGQCGACTVLVNGRRINSCLTLAAMHDGEEITTIEGLGTPQNLHPLQAAFVHRDGFQCGYCTPGQIVSAVGMLKEVEAGSPSHVTASLTEKPSASDAEIRERMSGNLCRCAAYPNIVAAIKDVAA